MRFTWTAELTAPDGRYTSSGNLLADDLTVVVEQVERAIHEEWANLPLYTGHRLNLLVRIENMPTKP